MNVFAIRHGETAWSLSGQHTGATDIPLTDNGRPLAERMRQVLATKVFELVLCSPMQRARETCQLAGLGDRAIIDSDLVEWNYGDYEGLTQKQINEGAPGWLIFRDGCPGGEAPEQVGARVDRVIARSRAVAGNPIQRAAKTRSRWPCANSAVSPVVARDRAITRSTRAPTCSGASPPGHPSRKFSQPGAASLICLGVSPS